MSWLDKLANEAKYAHDINYLGPAYIQAEQAAKELESEGKTEEAKEIRAAMLDGTINGAMLAGLGSGVLNAGKALLRKQLMPTIRLGVGMAGGVGGMYVGDKLVHTLSDGKYDTWGEMIQDKTKGIVTPTLAHLSNPLAILGGFVGAGGAGKAYAGTKRGKIDVLSGALDGQIENTKLGPSFIDQASFLGKFGWAPKQTVSYRHGSLDPDLKVFEPKFDRWDVKHGASPYQYFVTDQTTPVDRNNMMDLRPMQYTGELVFEKPMVQVGEIRVKGPDGRTIKNTPRNQLVARARQQGADGYLMQGIEDNKVPNQNVVVRFIGSEGEAVQGKPATVEWYGPTMGKTTAAKVDPNLVDIDPLLKPIRLKHAERLGLKVSDPKVSADPAYKQEVADFVLEWRANPENQGKTLVASTKHLLDPEYNIQFANEPAIPEFDVFAARNKARGFKETDEQLRAWYNSILEQGRDLTTDNRFLMDIKVPQIHSKLSEAELAGTPKVIRNNKLQEVPWDQKASIERKAIQQVGKIPVDEQVAKPFSDEEIALMDAWKAENAKQTNKDFLKEINDDYMVMPWDIADDSDDVIRNISTYLSQNQQVQPHPNFLRKDGNQSHYVAMYRKYMQHLGYDTGNLSNEDIAKLLTLQYNSLIADQTGQMKGQILWHSSPEWFDSFNWKRTGSNTGNMGYGGPGNYFSLIGKTSYGGSRNKPVTNDQPYLITEVSSLPSVKMMRQKGIKPEYTSPHMSWSYDGQYEAEYLRPAIQNAVEGNMMIIDDASHVVLGQMNPQGKQVEFGLTRNSGIKSLFPHPSLFVRNPDGTVSIARDWRDIRINYKQGGSIKIKKKNRGKFTASAKAAGEGVQEHAHKVMNDPNATLLQKKRANFAIQAKKWHRKHQLGSKINYLNLMDNGR